MSRVLARAPILGRLWARWASFKTDRDVPWTPFTRPLAACRVTLVTTGGVHRRDDRPFDMTDPNGDPTFREIPAETPTKDLAITHDYYDHRDADRDVNIVFPLDRFRELVERHALSALTRTHFGFMGHIDGPLVRTLETRTIPALLERLSADWPDFVFLIPA